jgi:acetate kinase
MTAQAVNILINRQSGLLGVSGASDDVQELLIGNQPDAHAAEALEPLCYRAKNIWELVAALGGLDILVFTGGSGRTQRDPATHLRGPESHGRIAVTRGQLAYEWSHLLRKLRRRAAM